MVTGVLAIAAAIGLVILLLDGLARIRRAGIRHHRWAGIRRGDLGLVVGLNALLALGLGLGQLPVSVAVLVGGLVGIGLVGLSGCGRAGQGLVVLLLSGATWQALEVGSFGSSLFLWGCGVGMGVVGIPLLWRMTTAEAVPLLLAMSQGWIGIAALTWGSRLMEMGSQQDLPGPLLLPVGLAALSLVAGTVPVLAAPDREQTPVQPGLLSALGHGVGWLVATTLALVLVRNGLYQDPVLALLFGVGGLVSWGLSLLEGSQEMGAADSVEPTSGPEPSGLLLWRACLGLGIVGGGALLALRLGGSYGAALLGLGCLAFPSRWGAMAALFLAARPLLQNLVHQFNLQAAGIDLTQAYVSAALYLGIAAVLLAGLIGWLYGREKPLTIGLGLTLASLALPLGVGYLIHAQPQAAFLLGALMTALVLAALEPVFSKQLGLLGAKGLCLTVIAMLTASLSRDWTVTGFYATRVERALVLGGIGGAGLLLLLLWQGWSVWQQLRLRQPG